MSASVYAPSQVTHVCLQAMLPGLNVTSISLDVELAPSLRGTLAPAMSYKPSPDVCMLAGNVARSKCDLHPAEW